MKTKSPKCIKCNKPMKAIYTKESYNYDNKIKFYWSKQGYICNHFHYPIIKNTYYHEAQNSIQPIYMIDVYDIDILQTLKALRKIFRFINFFF